MDNDDREQREHEREQREKLQRITRMKGYEHDPCAECGHYTILRNGGTLKCDTCGWSSNAD